MFTPWRCCCQLLLMLLLLMHRLPAGVLVQPLCCLVRPPFLLHPWQVAEDEARHFTLLRQRLGELGSHYGALPAHDGLWESASGTAANLPARLAVEHCVHEARGLDVMPGTIAKFRNNGDEATAALLEGVIFPEEVTHCAAGVRWLSHLHRLAHSDAALLGLQSEGAEAAAGANDACGGDGGSADGPPPQSPAQEPAAGAPPEWVRDAQRHGSVQGWFQSLVRGNFRGALKPPFNDAARASAGFSADWYLPLAAVSAPLSTVAKGTSPPPQHNSDKTVVAATALALQEMSIRS